ncbi:IPT/TIG domain-containing protein [Nocardia nova SH22a]|uniref:IPT/TIG domain-containing protein n=1 Tax=Nocardia nova SH22a TaxID=1415166 RepID=W5TY03_9NOCA|nr:IPT/TIG domain-containing protein [Nocardia nova]AHH22106.1 IPT/TIG domain-containing protein [Nocardia nova SH22a]
MAGASVAKIGVGAPNRVTGGIMVFAPGDTLPVGVSGDASAGTKLGYVADDGLRPSGERSSTDIFDWAGDLIYSPQDQHSAQFQFKLYGAFDADVLTEVFGEENVTTVGSLITVTETGSPLGVHPWLFDMRDGGKKARFVVPEGQITAATEDPLIRNGLQAFDCTLTCYKDEAGVKVYRYYDDGSSPAAPIIGSAAPTGTIDADGGELLVLTGANFTGTTGVKVGGTDVLDFQIVNDQTLTIITPAHAAGAVTIVATNAAGASAGFPVTYAA